MAPAATIRSGPSGYICAAAAAAAASVVSTACSPLAAHTNYLHRVTQADEGALSLAESACLRYHLRPRQEPKSLMRWRVRKRLDGSGHAHGLSLPELPWYMRVLTGDICACLPGGAGSTEPVAAAASPPRVRDAAGWAVLAVRLEPSSPRRRTIAHGTRSWCATSPCYCTVPVYHYWGRDAQDHALVSVVWSAAVSLQLCQASQ